MAKRVIVIFPRFERINLIEQLRRKFDPLALSVKAHITLVLPFESDISSDELHSHIKWAVENIRPFDLKCQSITGREDEYLFLNVKRGNDQLIQLHDQLYTGPLAPYLRPQYTYLPHLTVGRLSNRDLFLQAVESVKVMRVAFETQVTEIAVYSIRPDGTRPVELSVSL